MIKKIAYLIRTLTRPIALIMVVGATIALIITNHAIPDQWWGLLMMIVAWWFADRSSRVDGDG